MGIRVTELTWISQPGAATDIGVDNSAWVIGTDPIPGGYGIFYWKGDKEWAGVDGAAVNIAVGFGPWVVNSAGSIFSSQTAVVDDPAPSVPAMIG
jgi:hypothetical protein